MQPRRFPGDEGARLRARPWLGGEGGAPVLPHPDCASPHWPTPSRAPQVLFECQPDPEAEGIVSVAELAACRYEMRVATPLACGALRPQCGGSCDALAVPWLQQSPADCAGARRADGAHAGGAYQCTASPLRVVGCEWLADSVLCCGGRADAEPPLPLGASLPTSPTRVCCMVEDGAAAAKGAGAALVTAVAQAAAVSDLQEQGWCRAMGDFASSCRSPGSPSATVCTALGVPHALAAVGDLLD